MLNITKTLDHLNISSTSRIQAVQEVRAYIEQSNEIIQPVTAAKLVFDMIGVDVKFEDINQALFTTQYIVDTAITQHGDIDDAEIALQNAMRKADAFITNVNNSWMFAKKDDPINSTEVQTVVEGLDVKVSVKADGSIKKGGKQVLAFALYEKHVIAAKVKPTNSWFKELLCTELGMSAAGASTYAYNCDAPHSMLVKASKGGAKPKVAVAA